LGAGATDNRTLIGGKSFEWPNLIKLNLLGETVMAQGETNSVKAYVQAAQSLSDSPDPVLAIYLDDDLNPWNGNERLLKEIPLPRNPSFQLGLGTVDFVVAETNYSWGTHAVFGKIIGAGMTRYLYAPEFLTLMSSFDPADLSIAGGAGLEPRIDV
jgi:hypothetical protein